MHFILNALLLSGGLLASVSHAAAQAIESRTPATDTIQPANPRFYVPLSRLCTVSGKQFTVFIKEDGEQPKGIEFTWRNPMVVPHPRPVLIPYEQVRWVRSGGNYYLPLCLPKQPTRGLILRRSAGPRVEVYEIAWRKAGVVESLPLVGVASLLFVPADSAEYRYHDWYVRRPGEKTMTPVPKNKKFAPFMAAYLADAPQLATAVRTGLPGHCYDDVPALLATYNQALTPGLSQP